MKVRKIIVIMLVLVMATAGAVTMSACGEDPLATYNEASDKIKDAEDVTYDGDITVKMTSQGNDMELKGDFDMIHIKPTGDDVLDYQMAANINMDAMGQKVSMKMYTKDKTVYVDALNSKTKVSLDSDEGKQIKEMVDKMQAGTKIDDYVKDSKQDGDKLTFTLDTEKMMSTAMEKMDDAKLDNDAIKQYEELIKQAGLGDATLEATVADGALTSQKVIIPMTIDLGAMYGLTGSAAEAAKVESEVTMNLSKIEMNTGAKIDFPDFKDYK